MSLETSLILFHITIGHVGTTKTDSVNIFRDYLVPGTAVRCRTPIPTVPAALSQYILKKGIKYFIERESFNKFKIQ
jgi:hypothetical protein